MLPRRFFLITLVILTAQILQAQSIKGIWQRIDSLPLIEEGVFAAASDQLAYYIGSDQGWKTTDGGDSWSQIVFPSELVIGPTNIFTFGSTVLLFQQRFDNFPPMIVRSTDAGASWQVVNDSNSFDNLKTVTMWSPTGIHVISVDGVGAGKSYVSNDGGITFQEGRADTILQKYIAASLSGTKRYTIAAAWSDSLHGVISLAPRNIENPPAHVLVTNDAGTTWKEVLLPSRNDTLPIPGKVYTIPGTSNFWVNVTDITLPGYYYLSTDYGETWRASRAINRPLELLSPIDTSTVWALFSAFQYPELNQNKTYVSLGLESAWSQIMGIPGGNSGRSINYFKFFSPTEGWATGTRVNATGDLFYYIYRFVPQSGVAEIAELPKLFIHPSPASSLLTVRVEDAIQHFTVTDMLGRDVSSLVKQESATISEVTLNIEQLEVGAYVLQIRTTAGKAAKDTFIKQ